ncbi:MAG: DUF805 domain-containing protein [Erythrobacter sp.]
MHWMILPLKRYVDFEGRSRRMEFWSFALLLFAVFLIFAGPFYFSFFTAIFSVNPTGPGSEEAMAEAILASFTTMNTIGLIVSTIFSLVVLIPWIAVTVRRLHDLGQSGWWYLGVIVASMIPFVGLLTSLAFLVVLLLPGTKGDNRFGPDPKATDLQVTFD